MNIACQVGKVIVDRWREHSKDRAALDGCNSKLDDCQGARSRCEAQKRVLTYVLVFAVVAVLIGSMFFTITRSQV